MKLAILMTNTDESEFAQNHPKDGEKFSQMITMVRPLWQCTVYAVKDGVFPRDLLAYDGAMITGSPASVGSDAPWIKNLFALIRQAHARQFPMFGACFGHQAICTALGGTLGRNRDGWGHGVLRNWGVAALPWREKMGEFYLYGSHIEQILNPPVGATIVSASESCANAGISIANHIFTTQHHPEMSHDFIVALVEELSDYVGQGVTQNAKAALSKTTVDPSFFAQEVARFFEHANA